MQRGEKTRADPVVLFLHGLESGPGGSKARYFKKHFLQAHVPDMHMSAYNPSKKNSPMRALLPLIIAVVIAVGILPSKVALLVLGMLLLALIPLTRWRLRVALDACAKIQEEAIARVKPDVIVGSSWGGAVALRCLELKYWQGPTLLLAPAIAVKGWWGFVWPSWEPSLSREVATRCHVIQGELDDTVPASIVVSMCHSNNIGFDVIPDGDHRLNDALIATNKLQELVHNLHASTLNK